MNKPNQRIGAKSNAHVGRDFELAAKSFFTNEGLSLDTNIKIPIGISGLKKVHAFDLGSLN
ncbi:hypothetical protein ACW5XW_09545 [Aeromonas piscicola]|nr:hypothetical protein [Aeromonas piscicola]